MTSYLRRSFFVLTLLSAISCSKSNLDHKLIGRWWMTSSSNLGVAYPSLFMSPNVVLTLRSDHTYETSYPGVAATPITSSGTYKVEKKINAAAPVLHLSGYPFDLQLNINKDTMVLTQMRSLDAPGPTPVAVYVRL